MLKVFGKLFHCRREAGAGADRQARQQPSGGDGHGGDVGSDGDGRQGGPRRQGAASTSSTPRAGATAPARNKFPRAILPRTFDFGFATGLSYKDVRLCVDEAEAMGVPMVVGGAVREMLAVTRARFGAGPTSRYIAKVLEEWAGASWRIKDAARPYLFGEAGRGKAYHCMALRS